jgi:hypothetical protein
VSFELRDPVAVQSNQAYAILVTSPAVEIAGYEWGLSSGDQYPTGGLVVRSGGVTRPQFGADALFRIWVGSIVRDDLDGDGIEDSVDPDDDGDGAFDATDNCPIVANPSQDDVDHDELGDACDAQFDAGPAVAAVEEDAVVAVSILAVVSPPGVNGLIAKLTGNGGVVAKVSSAFAELSAGDIALGDYLFRLQTALWKLDDFDAQLAAKIANGQIGADDGANLQAVSASIRDTIEALQANASPPVAGG